ncbi:MAG: AMP-binding protein [Peptococcaceae bacterium]|nr:AMP-binding protein [Peptococcaceae bacterium]
MPIGTLADMLPWWERLIGKICDRIPSGKYSLGENIFTFKDLLRSGVPYEPEPGAAGGKIAEMLYTGGTTGFPKGVPISGALFLEGIGEQRKAAEGVVPRGEDVVIQGAPLYHIPGQTVGMGALFAGDTLVLLPKINLDAVFDHIERYRAKTFFGTPTLYRMILEHDRLDQYNLGSLQCCFSSRVRGFIRYGHKATMLFV